MRTVILALTVLLCLTACTQGGAPDTTIVPADVPPAVPWDGKAGDDAAALDAVEQQFLVPLGLTGVIGQSWSSPDELDPDSVMIMLEIKILGDDELYARYAGDVDNLYLPRGFAEGYAADSFGMTPEQLRASRYYDSGAKRYVVPIGLGGAWGYRATGWEGEGGRLAIRYDLISARDIVTAHGVIVVETRLDGSHRYLSNTVVEEIYAILEFPAATDFALGDATATMNSGGRASVGPDTDHMVDYDGGDLTSVVGFYVSKLDEIGASGETDMGKHPDGWFWSGTFGDGNPLTIDIRPATAEGGYTIVLTF